MVLSTPMEEKQLDLNQPFLSVRRNSSTPTPAEAQEQRRKVHHSVDKLPPLPRYKSELKSGPVRKPGKVPFVWEKAPGKPKEDNQPPNCTALDRCHASPKLPPGSSQKVKVNNQNLEKDSVIFMATDSQVCPGQAAKPATKNECCEEVVGIGHGGNSCLEEGDDEAFVDALETFSWSDTFLNCSITSGLDGLNGVDLRSIERFNPGPRLNPEPVAQDFIMCRFLPAAMAMAAEAPQHTTRKPMPLAPQEIPRPEKVSNNWMNIVSPRVEQNGPMIPPRYIMNGHKEESEDDDCNCYDNPPAKVCGLLPRFCLLSPVAGIKHMQHHMPHSARRIQEKSSYKIPAPKTRAKRNPSKEGREDKHDSRTSSEALQEKDGKRLVGSSLCRQMQGNGQFLKQKEITLREAFEADGSAGTASQELCNSSVKDGSSPPSKQCLNFRELLASEGIEWESSSTGTGPVAERTLYVDYVQLVKPRVPSSHEDLKAKNAALWKPSCQQTEQSYKMKDEEREEIKKQINPVPCDASDCGKEASMAKPSTSERESAAEGKSKNNANLNFHLPPPLPKTPSDSWLSRTLHSVSSQSPSSSEAPSGTKIVLNRAIASKSPPAETKWETIVRTSNIHHEHLRFSKVVSSAILPIHSSTLNSYSVLPHLIIIHHVIRNCSHQFPRLEGLRKLSCIF
ncbi:hypothetical protein SAY87_030102 [Trapa incisa]|uniref:Uncharacterized protein n=1 Tax=Trapa incisa TaxID=236973 RepID=A0AAN7KCY3_9MYRT|nr:hypothetical protein SAY87_030102 [Trapa incisa]